MAETFTGTVKFVHETGFLFLGPDDHASSDIFGHCTDWEKGWTARTRTGRALRIRGS
jgi:hypothetical protein